MALLASLGIALLAGSLLIIAYGESPITVYSSILKYSVESADGIGYVLAIATPLIFSALAVAVCHVNRAPLAGTVTSVDHVPGGFVPAFNKESENN